MAEEQAKSAGEKFIAALETAGNVTSKYLTSRVLAEHARADGDNDLLARLDSAPTLEDVKAAQRLLREAIGMED